MENIEKVAYLRGMLEGMKFDADSDMGKIVLKLIDIVDDLAHDLTDAEERADVMADYIDELDHDLGEVEEYVYGDDCDCCDDGGAVCPKCGAEFELDLDALENGDIITCPECGAELNFEYVDDEDETEE